MFNREVYIASSLEVNLFFARIMKEHAIFLKAGFTPKNTKLAKQAESYKMQFEKILLDATKLSNSRIENDILTSGEIFTSYTLSAEKKTQFFTGININSKITCMQKDLRHKTNPKIDDKTLKCIKNLNCKVINSLKEFIDFKKLILNKVSSCELYTSNYPTLASHVIHEAELYLAYIQCLENDKDIQKKDIKETILFWDDIMKEHAAFIRGLLDPSENKLINTSNQFVKEYLDILYETENINNTTASAILKNTLLLTNKLKDFKSAGTEGILNCKIKSIILPLLSDHVLREANHYIRLLKKYNC